jgi:hypothetical protein
MQEKLFVRAHVDIADVPSDHMTAEMIGRIRETQARLGDKAKDLDEVVHLLERGLTEHRLACW